ncbi:MAG: DNA polymerase III subunit delta [Alcanivoracaceae bacterium]|jgi:DNA polymerase-3 subunit delta|nr:DNA polymerase III subunit delta [Alcanivoracaceae bacterium]
MQIRAEQLDKHLQQSLLPAYLIAGDEPFQLGECSDLLRRRAREQGFDDRQTFSVADRFDWHEVLNEAQSMGLFGGRKLIELRLGDKRPDKEGSAVICQLLGNPADDILLLITASKLDRRRDVGSKWVSAVDKAGGVIDVWPIDADRLPGWIEQRCRQRGLQADRDAIALLSELSEGNLLACAQEVDKLALLFPNHSVSVAEVQQSVGDCSRYSIFDLTDALSRDPTRALRILDGLRAEGTDEVQILWALAREARIYEAFVSGHGSSQRLPPQKAAEAERHAIRLGLPAIGAALALAARIDQSIKGMRSGDAASGNTALALKLAGQPLPAIFELI